MSLPKFDLPTERSFGFLFTLVFFLLGTFSASKSYYWAVPVVLFSVSLFFLSAALTAPRILSPLNQAWHALGLFIGKIANPVVLGVIYFVLLTPIAVITRLFGRDILKLKKQNVSSYWVNREPLGPDPESFKNQF